MVTETPTLTRALGGGGHWQQPGPGPTHRWKGQRGSGPCQDPTTLQLPPRALTHPGEFQAQLQATCTDESTLTSG